MPARPMLESFLKKLRPDFKLSRVWPCCGRTLGGSHTKKCHRERLAATRALKKATQ